MRPTLPLEPVSIALETLKIDRRSDQLSLVGIDLDSGRRMRLQLEYVEAEVGSAPKISDLVLVLTMHGPER
ncbi:MAG: hypothetical protein EON59_06165 [Alphaproteobacteria bacterium]|nr:MAG: hypothetical protein EON59_06165 [Alphaproteobacteria bacterium]